MTNAVTLRDLKKSFRIRTPSARSLLGAVRGLVSHQCTEFRAVDGISFSIEKGERVADGVGTLLARLLILVFFGFGIAYAPSGGLAFGGLLVLLCGALTAVVAATLNLIFCAIIGLSAFFVEDTSSLYWVWQKLGFVFGGWMFPLDIYPDAVRTVANATPFPSLLYAPGRIGIGAEPAFVWQITLVLAGWLIVRRSCSAAASSWPPA